jgi:hypothetical protein
MAKTIINSGSGLDLKNASITNKVININDATAGITPNKPAIATKSVNPVEDLNDHVQGVIQKQKMLQTTLRDDNEYGKTFTFDNSPSSASFKARYKGYGQDTYNRIGFDPQVNNEAIYNQNTSTFDDMGRWLKHSAAPMLGLGFLAPIHSYGKLLGSGDVGADRQEAKDYEYYNSIGYSSRGGIGGFATNLLNSVSYSAGILLEGAVEGAMVSGAIGAATGGELNLLGGALGGMKALTKLPSALFQSAKNIGKITKSLQALKNINNAKNFWNTAGTIGKKTAEFINPFENTLDAVKLLKETDDVSKLARTARTAGAFWHDVMGINMALSEGRLEGGFSEQNVYNRLYNDYYAKHGKAPSIELQQEMMLDSKKAGFKNTLYNTGLVFYSNKVAFPSITRAKFLKGAPRLNFGKVVGEVGNEFQIMFNPADDIAKAAYTKEAISLKNSIKALKSPKQWGKLGLNYFKGNLMEGIQEISQEALASAVEKYYVDSFYNPSVRGYRYGLAAMFDGLDKQLNAQGGETFASGFLMGSLLEGPSKMFKFGTKNFSRIFKDKAVNEEYVKQREAQADAIVNSLNNMHKNAKYFFDPRINNYSNQMLTAKMVDNPDNVETKVLKDAEFAAFQSSVQTALRTGTYDTFLDNLKEYKNTTPEELEQAWSLEPGQGEKALQNIDKVIGSAKVTAARYKMAKDKFKDYVDPQQYKEGSPEYTAAIIYNKAYEESINSLVFLQSTFDDHIDRLGNMYKQLDKLKSISSNPFSNFDVITDAVKLNEQINYLKQDIESGETSTLPEAVAQVRQKRELLKALDRFQKAQDSNSGENLNLLLNAINEGTVTPEMNEYFNAFENLLETIAGSEENKVTLRNEIDNLGGHKKLFDSLIDIHFLKHEQLNTAKYINILADPAGFRESVNRNFDWMKRMYDNRKEYYKDIVNQEITNVERNEILNTLAADGIFVDLEEFAKFVEDPENYLPEYFIDTTKEMVINKDSVLYEKYAVIFIQAARLSQKKPAGDPATEKQKLDDELTDLTKDKNDELRVAAQDYDQSFIDEVGMSVQEATAKNQDAEEANAQLEIDQKAATEKIGKLQNLLELVGKDPIDSAEIIKLSDELLTKEELELNPNEIDNDAVDAIYNRKFKKADPDTIDNAVFRIYVLSEKSPTLLAEKIAEQKEVLKKEKESLTDIEGTKSFKVNEERVSQINERYTALENQILNKYKEKGVDKSTVDEFTPQMGYANFPEDLQSQIDTEFNTYLTNELEMDPKSLMDTNIKRYEEIRQNWIEKEGLELLKKYNEQVKTEGAARAEALTKPPVLTSRIFKSIKIEASMPTGTLNVIIDKMEATLKTKIFNDGSTEFKLSEQDINEISEDVQKLKTFLQYKQGKLQPISVAEKVFNSFRKNVQGKQDELEDVFDEDGNKIGRKFAGDPDSKLTTRATTISDGIATELSDEKKPGYSDDNVDKIVNVFFSVYNDHIKKGDSDAFNKAWEAFSIAARDSYKQLNTEDKKARIRASLEKNTTEENFRKLIGKEAFSNNSEAGTNLDAAVRTFFTIDAGTGTWKSFKYSDTIEIEGKEAKISDIMSEKAFDEMFGIRGVVTRFRESLTAQNFTPLTNNVKLFDKNLLENGASGETDMVLINNKGEIMIVDIKTSTSWNGFNKPNSWKNIAYRAQLSIYRNLYHNMTGVIPRIALFPMRITLKNATPYVTSVTVGGEKTRDSELVPLVSNTAKLFNTLELEYLPDVEGKGITMSAPEISSEVETPGEETKEVEKVKPSTQTKTSDTSKLTLNDNVGKQVVFNGRIGTLILQADGSYGVEVDLGFEQSMSETLIGGIDEEGNLTGLMADLAFAKGEFGDPDKAEEIQKQIDDLQKTKKGKEIYTVTSEGKPATNGSSEITSVGLSLITPVKKVGQISVINNQVIDAAFEDENETIAIVNGVRYTVSRSPSGDINQLVYFKNDKRREDIDNIILAINSKIAKLRQKITGTYAAKANLQQRLSELERQNAPASQIKKVKQDLAILSPQSILSKINKGKEEIDRLNAERDSLSTDDKVFIYEGNTNDVIFALNRLPNSFQKNSLGTKPQDIEKELKKIHSLSDASPKVQEEVTMIMQKNLPKELTEVRLQGISALGRGAKKLEALRNGIQKTIDALKEYETFKMYSNDPFGVAATNRQINVLKDLLDHLVLINLTETNRIAKKQDYEQDLNKIFGAESGDESNIGVSEIQSPTGSTTEGVSGMEEAGETKEIPFNELQKIVNSSIDELAELTPEVNKATEAFAKIKDTTELFNKKKELMSKMSKNKLKLAQIESAYQNRLAELENNVDINSLKKGDLLQDITNFTEQDSPVQVVDIKENSVILKYGDTKREVTEEELQNNFVKPSKETQMTQTEKPSQETVDASEQTKTDAKTFFENKETEASDYKEAKESNEDDLFKNLEDNSKTCY